MHRRFDMKKAKCMCDFCKAIFYCDSSLNSSLSFTEGNCLGFSSSSCMTNFHHMYNKRKEIMEVQDKSTCTTPINTNEHMQNILRDQQ